MVAEAPSRHMRALFAAAAAAMICCSVGTAHADHTEEQRQTDFSAFLLNAREMRIGLTKIEYGIFDRWMVGTYTVPWLLMPIAKGPILNVTTKVGLLEFERFQLAGRLHVFYADIQWQPEGESTESFNGTIVPVSALASWLFGKRWTLSAEATWVETAIHGDVESASDASGGGVIGQSNFQLAATAEYRWGPHVAINLVTRFAPFVEPLAVTATATTDQTTISIQAEVDSNTTNAFLIQPGFAFSWGIWNLRLGLGVGNIFIPGPGLVTAVRTLVPDLDFYARF